MVRRARFSSDDPDWVDPSVLDDDHAVEDDLDWDPPPDRRLIKRIRTGKTLRTNPTDFTVPPQPFAGRPGRRVVTRVDPPATDVTQVPEVDELSG